jgi:FtsH-binding integral membrane protein
MHPLTPLRWMSYMLIALGLINWRYQSGEALSARNSLLIIAVGALLVLLLFLPKTARAFSNRIVKAIAWAVVSGAVLFAILN